MMNHMKKTLFSISLLFVSVTAIFALCSWDNAPLKSSASSSTYLITTDDDWILIGEISLYTGIPGTVGYKQLPARLYVRTLADKLIYRVEYNGKYYAPRFDASTKTHSVTINEITYRCDVPVGSNDGNGEEGTTKKGFEGTWNATDNDSYISSISITNNGDKFLVKLKSHNKLLTTNSAYVNNGKIHGSVIEFTNYGEWKISNYYNSGNTCYITEIDGYKTSRIGEIPKENVSDYSQKATVLNFVMYFTGEMKDGDLKIHAWHTYEWGRENYKRMFYEDTPAQIYQTFTNW